MLDSSSVAKVNDSQNISKNFKFESSRQIEIEIESQSYIEKNESKNYPSTKHSTNGSKENVIVEIKEENEEDEKEEEEKEKEKKEKEKEKEKNLEKNEELIGKGGFSKVYKSNIMIEVAKKVIKNKDSFIKEKKYLKLLNNSEIRNYIVKYYKSDDKKNILYLELCEGNLKQLRNKIIKKYNIFPLFIIQNIMKQINKVMKYLIFKLNLSYNDMKPENILFKTIDEENDLYEIKLCDFNLVENNIKTIEISKGISGTTNYMDDDKKSKYDGKYFYDQYLTEIYSLGNIMYYLFFGKIFNKNDRKEIYKIKDKDFNYILKDTLSTDLEKISIKEYFNAKFFKKNRKDLKDGLENKYFELSMDDAKEIAIKTYKFEKTPKILDFDLNVINAELSSNIKHFTSFNENNVFNLVCYNNNENQIEIYQENNSKYLKSEKKIIKINENLKNINDIIIYEDYIIILSSPICYLSIKNNFKINFINKKIIFSQFITINNKKFIIYLNENKEIGSYEFEINNETNEFKIIKENSIIKLNYKNKINEFDCFKTSKNDILIYFYTNNLIQIYNLTNKKLIFSKEKDENIKIISLCITEIENKIYVIYLTTNKQGRKQLINILIFNYENFNNKLIKLNECEKKFIAHKEQRKMEKIKLFDNNNLIIKIGANLHLYDLKKNFFYAYSKIGENLIENCKISNHFYYGKCILSFRILNKEKKVLNLYYFREFYRDYFEIKSLVIKKIANELFNFKLNEYICGINYFNFMEMTLVERLMILNDENNKELYKIIKEKKDKIENNIDSTENGILQ